MRILMLGWEFPPFISGGLGTACYGLTKALSRQHNQIIFVLPRAAGGEYTTHVRLLQPQTHLATATTTKTQNGRRSSEAVSAGIYPVPGELPNVTFRTVPVTFASPYGHGEPVGATVGVHGSPAARAHTPSEARPRSVLDDGGESGPRYTGDLIAEAQRYADLCVALTRGPEAPAFDVIHAHDWLTFPAGMAVAAATGKPLVAHVHSTEFDRSGENIHQQIYDIERQGVHAASRVIAVSYLTRSILERRYGLAPAKIDVVYNGVENGRPAPLTPGLRRIHKGDKIVLFLGRITMQKGPEYFVAAAKKVLSKYDKVKFIMAGSGDKVRDVIDLAAREGIGHKVLFTGFLRGHDVARIFRMADVYVMPSVSEPFGIAALEAISNDVPVIISKTSGVSEVLRHALKVDFWDINEMANKILAVLRHPPLASTLRSHADVEVRRLTWDGAASRCRQVYDAAGAVN